MPEYQYWATTEIGDTVTGNVSAATPDDASHLLTLRGLSVRRLETIDASPDAAETPVAMATNGDFAVSVSGRDGPAVAVLPLVTSLAALQEETSRPRLRWALNNAILLLQQGQPLEEVFGKLQAVLPRRMTALFPVGRKSGRLPELLQQALRQLHEAAELRRRVWLSLAYPLCLIGIACLVVGGIIYGVVPGFARIFDDFGTQLPPLTMVLVQMSKLGGGRFILFALGALALAALTVGAITACGGRHLWERCQLWIPLIGAPFRTAALAGLLRMLAVLVEYGVPLPEAFRAAAAFQDNASLSTGVEHIAADLEHGVSPLEAVRVSEIVPREVLPIFRWADNPALFVETLKGAADILSARAQLNCGIFGVIVEPVPLFGVGLSMACIVLALFLPLIRLLNDLS